MRRLNPAALAASIVWIMTSSVAVSAPLTAKITNGDPLLDARPHHSYMMEGQAGQHLLVSMKSKSFAPYIVVQDPNGNVVGRFSGGAPGETVGVDLRLEDSGGWLVMAMGTEPGQTGSYELDLDMVGQEQLAATADVAAAEVYEDASSPLPDVVEAEPEFCDAVNKLVTSAPSGFKTVRGEALDDGKRWTSNANLPGAVSCDIVKFSNFSAVCHVKSSASSVEILNAFNSLSGKLRSCLNWSWSHSPTGGIEQYFVGSSGNVTIAVSLTEVGGDTPFTLVMSVDAAG